MQTIGETKMGKLVEMTLEEHDEFARLERIVAGQWPAPLTGRYSIDVNADLGPTFAVIRAFAESRYRVNELQDAVDILRRVLAGEVAPDGNEEEHEVEESDK